MIFTKQSISYHLVFIIILFRSRSPKRCYQDSIASSLFLFFWDTLECEQARGARGEGQSCEKRGRATISPSFLLKLTALGSEEKWTTAMEGELGQKCNWIEFHAIGPLTPCHWIIHHSIRQYTSCHWIGLHFIGSYVILSYHIFCHWIGLHFIGSYVIHSFIHSFIRASCNCNTSFCQKTTLVLLKTKFMSLDRRPFDRTIYVMPLDRSSCHWIRNVIPSGPRLIEKSLFPRVLFQIRNSKYGGSSAGSTSNSTRTYRKQHNNGTSWCYESTGLQCRSWLWLV